MEKKKNRTEGEGMDLEPSEDGGEGADVEVLRVGVAVGAGDVDDLWGGRLGIRGLRGRRHHCWGREGEKGEEEEEEEGDEEEGNGGVFAHHGFGGDEEDDGEGTFVRPKRRYL